MDSTVKGDPRLLDRQPEPRLSVADRYQRPPHHKPKRLSGLRRVFSCPPNGEAVQGSLYAPAARLGRSGHAEPIRSVRPQADLDRGKASTDCATIANKREDDGGEKGHSILVLPPLPARG